MTVLISDIAQASLDDFCERPHRFDILIVAFGADLRSTHVLSRVRRNASRVLAASNGFLQENSDDAENFRKKYSAEVRSYENISDDMLSELQTKDAVSICIDVSCMSRVGMAEIFAALKKLALRVKIQLTLAYCLARYISPPEVKFPLIRRVAPVNPAFAGWGMPPSLPVDSVVSLGYENGKAIGAVEYLEPRNRWVFVPHSPEQRFLREVRKQNKLLMETSPDTIVDYDVLQPADTYYTLLSLVVGLVRESRPVLLPFGPKIFFALSLLVAMRVEKTSVWHVDGDDESPRHAPQPSSHTVLMSCELSAE